MSHFLTWLLCMTSSRVICKQVRGFKVLLTSSTCMKVSESYKPFMITAHVYVKEVLIMISGVISGAANLSVITIPMIMLHVMTV